MSGPVITRFVVRQMQILAATVLVVSITQSAASGQTTFDQERGNIEEDSRPTQNKGGSEPDSLDELLGLEGEGRDPAAEDAARRQHLEALKRQLEESPPNDSLEMAIEQMDLSARMLDQSFDAGLGTQRLQEEILLRLDVLLDQARKGACKAGGGGGQPKAQPDSDPGRQQAETPAQNSAGGPAADSNPTTGSPPRAETGGELDESQSEWGHLPQRVRDMLLQGRRERFSSLYERLTREYYRRLAEEGSR